MLLEADADVNAMNATKGTALWFAVSNGNAELTRLASEFWNHTKLSTVAFQLGRSLHYFLHPLPVVARCTGTWPDDSKGGPSLFSRSLDGCASGDREVSLGGTSRC
eukprot:4742442-Amphidinium_carterae.1